MNHYYLKEINVSCEQAINGEHVREDFAEFARAALRVVPHLIDIVPESGRRAIDAALCGGACMMLEFGPLPAFDQVALVIVEREGRRHRLGSVSIIKGQVQ